MSRNIKEGFHVADDFKENYKESLLGRVIYYGNIENRREDIGVNSNSTVVYITSDGKHHEIDMESLDTVEKS